MIPYEQLKSVIQAANPEIMELKFGCWATNAINNYVCLGGDWFAPVSNGVLQGYNRFKFGDIKPYTHTKLLGRPIRLADVLLAMKSNTRMENTVLMMDLPGTFAYSDAQNHAIMRWNLKDDNLDHQSEECKQFLISLLVSK
jgi:hypothetical protein